MLLDRSVVTCHAFASHLYLCNGKDTEGTEIV
jgi:hypothetical protein